MLRLLCKVFFYFTALTLILLTWTIWRSPTNASKWRMGFNSAFKGLNGPILLNIRHYCQHDLPQRAYRLVGKKPKYVQMKYFCNRIILREQH